MGLLIFYLLLAIVVSFLCSILEAVILSITPSYVESIAKKKPIVSQELRQLKANIDKPLAAILSLNTIAHTIGAAGVGAQAALVFENVSVGLISGVLTILILIFSEIIPKTLGARYYRQLSSFTAKTLKGLVILMYPLVLLAKYITKLISPHQDTVIISREEFSAMADIGHKEGVFAESELRVIKNMIAFREIKVHDIMTPRTVVVAANDYLNMQDIYNDRKFFRFTRIPIYHEHRDNVIGYIHKHEVLEMLAKDQHKLPVKEIVRDLLLVPESLTIPQLFEKLMEIREHIALVVDEYGGMAGVVTLEDVMETLLGVEIVDEFDNIQDMQEYARSKWKSRAEAHGLELDSLDLDSSVEQFATPDGIRSERKSVSKEENKIPETDKQQKGYK